MLGTCFLATPLAPRCSILGTPWMARGSRMRDRSRRAGMRVMTVLYSPGKLPLGMGTEAVRQTWSAVSVRKFGPLELPREGKENEEPADAPCDCRMVERRERPAVRPLRPLDFFAMMISSKRRMAGSEAGFISRS